MIEMVLTILIVIGSIAILLLIIEGVTDWWERRRTGSSIIRETRRLRRAKRPKTS
jgi:uncharacterized iron-regulated membrane protein